EGLAEGRGIGPEVQAVESLRMSLIESAPMEQPIDVLLAPGRLVGLQRQSRLDALARRLGAVQDGPGIALEEEPLRGCEPAIPLQPIESSQQEAIPDVSMFGVGIETVGESDQISSVRHHGAQD